MQIRQPRVFSLLLILLLIAAPLISHAAKPGYSAPEAVPGARTVTVEEVKELFDAGVVIVDVRSPRLHARRHIPGAIHLDLKDAVERILPKSASIRELFLRLKGVWA